LSESTIDSLDPVCPFCGETEVLEVFDIFSDRSVMFETCCEMLHESVSIELSEAALEPRARSGPKWVRKLVEDAVGIPLRRLADHDGHLILDYSLEIRPVAQLDAKTFIREHHEHCSKPPAGWKFGAAIWNGNLQIGVMMVGRPVSRMIDQKKDTLEVNRLCLNRGLPDPLRWNACSQLYSYAAREAEARGYGHIITYLRDDEDGTSVKAAGWVAETDSAGGDWAREGRPRESQNTGRKIRWGKKLKPRIQKQRPPMALAA